MLTTQSKSVLDIRPDPPSDCMGQDMWDYTCYMSFFVSLLTSIGFLPGLTRLFCLLTGLAAYFCLLPFVVRRWDAVQL